MSSGRRRISLPPTKPSRAPDIARRLAPSSGATRHLLPRGEGSEPLSLRGEKARLTRHGRACLGAPAAQARAGVRSGGWGEGTVADRHLRKLSHELR